MKSVFSVLLCVASVAICKAGAGPETTSMPIRHVSDTNFTFAVCGDNRNGDDTYRYILKLLATNRSSFLINTGDLVPTGSEEHWKNFESLMAGFTIPFFPVAGNHDRGSDGLGGFKRWAPGNKEHYSFDWGELHFTMADDSIGGMSPAELAWVDADLAASKKPVKVVVHHMPAWNPEGHLYGMGEGREQFLALLEKHNVRFDLCGHDHGYRTGITNNTTLVVSGGGGAGLYHEPEKGGFFHYVQFTVNGTNVTFKPVPVPNQASKKLRI